MAKRQRTAIVLFVVVTIAIFTGYVTSMKNFIVATMKKRINAWSNYEHYRTLYQIY